MTTDYDGGEKGMGVGGGGRGCYKIRLNSYMQTIVHINNEFLAFQKVPSKSTILPTPTIPAKSKDSAKEEIFVVRSSKFMPKRFY